MIINITLPVYFQLKNKKILVGLSWYRNAHYFESNNVKSYYHNFVELLLKGNTKKFDKYTIEYTYFYKNRLSDTNNVVTVIDKFLQDALILCSVVKKDNVICSVGTKINSSILDKENPRIEVIIREVQ